MTGSERTGQPGVFPWIRGFGEWCVFLAIAVFASWPLCLSPASTISMGFETEATVPLLNVWTLWWNSDRLAAGFRGYWNAPIFFPTAGTLAFSESQPTMMVAAPVVWLTGSRALGYNIYFLLIQSLNGWSSQRLLRRIGHRRWLAFCGGVMCQMLPFIWWQSGVVQLTTLFGIVWTVHSLLNVFDPQQNSNRDATWAHTASTFHAVTRLFASRNRTDAVPNVAANVAPNINPPVEHALRTFDWSGSMSRGLSLGGAFCVTYLLCNYWGMYLALVLIPSSVWLWNASLFRRRVWIEIGLGAILAAAVLRPLAAVQKSLANEHHWTREPSLIRELSAHPRDFLDTPQTWPARDSSAKKPKEAEAKPEPEVKPNADSGASATAVTTIAWSRFPQWDSPEEDRRDLWPLGGGMLKVILTPIGLLAALITRGRRRWGLFAATFGAVAFGLSLGPTVWIASWVPGLAGTCPYELLQRYVPGFALIRSPFRFALFVQLAVVWLCIEALDLLNPGRWCRGSQASAAGETGQPRTATDQDDSRIEVQTTWSDHPRSIAMKLLPWCLSGLFVLSSLILVCEVWPPRQSLYTCPTAATAPAWILWLRENSEPGDALICLPFPTGYSVHDYEETAVWMYWGTLHRCPLVNGYSGFFPKHFVDLKENLAKFHYVTGDQAGQPQLKLYPWDSFGLKDVNICRARFAVVKRSFATRDDVWQHPITKFRWSWVTGDEEHQLDVYEILPPNPE